MLVKAEDLAYGHWPNILQAAGVDGSYFGKRSGPCPFCGGRDRYIWQDKNGGRYLCRSCTAEGDGPKYRGGMDFLMRHLGVDFRTAADYVRKHFNRDGGCGVQPIARPSREEEAKAARHDHDKALARMTATWNATREVTPGSPVDLYLRRRIPALQHIPAEIRVHPGLEYYDPPAAGTDRFVLVGRYPAMVVRGFNADGDLVQIHKTYLTPEGHKAPVTNPKKTDRGIGSNSFALRLGDPEGDTLGVCEGIETGLAARILDGLTVWPCHSSGILANFVLPSHLRGKVKKMVIYADSDELKRGKKAGSEAAAALATRNRQERLRTVIVRPARVGLDMVDLV